MALDMMYVVAADAGDVPWWNVGGVGYESSRELDRWFHGRSSLTLKEAAEDALHAMEEIASLDRERSVWNKGETGYEATRLLRAVVGSAANPNKKPPMKGIWERGDPGMWQFIQGPFYAEVFHEPKAGDPQKEWEYLVLKDKKTIAQGVGPTPAYAQTKAEEALAGAGANVAGYNPRPKLKWKRVYGYPFETYEVSLGSGITLHVDKIDLETWGWRIRHDGEDIDSETSSNLPLAKSIAEIHGIAYRDYHLKMEQSRIVISPVRGAMENPKKVQKTKKITWEEFAKALGLDYTGPDEGLLMDSALEQGAEFIKEYEQDIEWENDEERDRALQIAVDEIWMGMEAHWSVQHVLDRVLNLDDLVGNVNEWSERGQQMQIYEERVIKAGEGITNVKTDDEGITFTLAPPFMIAYIEAAYCVMSIGDEGMDISDMDSHNVAATMQRIAECEGRKISLDLDRWEEMRTKPSYSDVVRAIEKEIPTLKAAAANPTSMAHLPWPASPIIIEVRGGVLVEVYNLPEHWTYRVWDWDNIAAGDPRPTGRLATHQMEVGIRGGVMTHMKNSPEGIPIVLVDWDNISEGGSPEIYGTRQDYDGPLPLEIQRDWEEVKQYRASVAANPIEDIYAAQKKLKTIIVEMWQGVLQEVHNLPRGWSYELEDKDAIAEGEMEKLPRSVPPKTVRVIIEGGLVSDLRNIPRDYIWEVDDWDDMGEDFHRYYKITKGSMDGFAAEMADRYGLEAQVWREIPSGHAEWAARWKLEPPIVEISGSDYRHDKSKPTLQSFGAVRWEPVGSNPREFEDIHGMMVGYMQGAQQFINDKHHKEADAQLEGFYALYQALTPEEQGDPSVRDLWIWFGEEKDRLRKAGHTSLQLLSSGKYIKEKRMR